MSNWNKAKKLMKKLFDSGWLKVVYGQIESRGKDVSYPLSQEDTEFLIEYFKGEEKPHFKKHTYFVRVINNKVKQKYTSLGRANEGAKYRGGKVYAVDVINGLPHIVCRYNGICQCELDEEERNIKL